MLFSPLSVGPVTLANRVVLPAMVTRLAGEDGLVNDDIRDRYVRFALGEPGLMIIEAMAVHRARSGPLLRICGDEFLPGLIDLRKRCHDASPTKVFPQIIHFLKVARSGYRQTVGDLDAGEIRGVIEAYARAAERARAAGFDGVELHMAHAYTLSSFLSRLNPRRDDYGGSLDNRLRLPVEVLEAVRGAVGRDFPVGVRFVGEECVKGGYTAVDGALIAERLARAGADCISLSAGGKFEDAIKREGEPLYPYTGYSGDRCMPGAQYPDGANVAIAEAIRRHLRARGLSVPVCAAGKIGTLAMAQGILDEGKADLVGMARALLADPDLPRKWREGREDAVVRCQYGNVCKALDENFRRVTCTLWPRGATQAPLWRGHDPPRWPAAGPALRASWERGQVVLSWEPAASEALHGYDLLRAEGDGELCHLSSIRARSTRFEDRSVVAGARYRYALRAYDMAGNRGPLCPPVEIAASDA